MAKAIISFIQAFLFLLSSFAVSDSNFKMWADTQAVKMSSTADFEFDSITADDNKITEEEKQLCREWFNKNIVESSKPAYDFKVGTKDFRSHLRDWNVSVCEESETGAVYRGGKTTYITYTHKKSGLQATVEATIYEDFATCEWTVYIKNTASKNSPKIKDFYAADILLDVGDADLYFSQGSATSKTDFELYKSFINNFPMRFSANGGRSISFLPFFNVCGSKMSTILSVGWTGQWLVTLDKEIKGTRFKAGQEEFNAYLTAGEEVRSPLMSMVFYKSNNPIKGFNALRNWESECVYTESVENLNGYVIANEFSNLTTDDLINKISNISPEVLENTDYFWMDAGWYKCKEAWYDGVGNWIPDENRFPDGLKPLGDKINSMGKKFLLWYEPERVREGTYLYEEGMKHKGWIVKIDNDLLWNLGDEDACKFISDYISKSLVDNGVTIYRQDFNFDPLKYWQQADKKFYDRRKGICENHYVTNLYKYLDCLVDSVDGLVIDNCASGGRRLDIEMTRRSIPLWRSDYNCANSDGTWRDNLFEVTQAITYGISCWFTYSGSNRYFFSEYSSRTSILTNQSFDNPDVNELKKYDKVRDYMTENYYPLTYGGSALDKYLAMQFGSENEGAALIYKREEVDSNSYNLKMNGLDTEKVYSVYDMDRPDKVYSLSGEQLMNEGITLTIEESPKAVIVMYKAK